MKNSGTWLLRQQKAAAHATDFEDASALFGFYIRYDETTAEASLSIRHTVQLENLDALQTLTLLIRPENITHCELFTNSHDLINQAILDLIPDNAVKTAADLFRLDLTLKTPGRVLCPLTSLPIRPQQPGDHGFLAFSRLCTVTRIRIYIGKNQVSSDRQTRLQTFVRHVTERKLRAHQIDLRRLGGGEGVQESDWNDVYPDISLAPPTYQQALHHVVAPLDTSIARKRPRNGKSGSDTRSSRLSNIVTESSSPAASEQPSAKRPLSNTPPPWSPTEVNTPSTQGTGTPSSRGDMRSNIKTTKFTKKSPSPGDFVHVLSETFKKLPQELVESASRAAFGHLDKTTCVDVDLDASQVQAGLASNAEEVRSVVEAYLRPVVRTELTSMLDHKLDQRLEQLVDAKLPVLADAVLDDHMDKFLANVDDGHAQARMELREEMDDGVIELHQARGEGVKDVEEAVQEGIDDISDHVQAVVDALHTIQATASQLKRELRTLLIQQKLHARRTPKNITRRGSF